MTRRSLRFALVMGLFLLSCAIVIVDAGAGAAQAPTPPPGLPSNSGRLLYLEGCAFCHGDDGGGTNRGPSLVGVGDASVDFMLSTGRMPIGLDEVDLPDADRKTPVYTRDEILAIIDYVGSFGVGGEPVPFVQPQRGDLVAGNRLYLENCAACHSSVGIGDALTSGLQAPSLHASTSVQTAEAIRVGPGTMPVFGSDTIDDDQLNSLVAYVDYLRRPDNRGGASLGHVGPITEGAIAWIVGLGALALVIRWIGERE
jgi:ubiquinol-cytochrome c reductase cytochrome c subunit